MFGEPEEPEENPFRNYRHTASVVGLPVFICALLLLLASVQPAVSGTVGIGVWCAVGIVLLFVLSGIAGRIVIRGQVRKGNPHCATAVGRRYMQLVFIGTIVEAAGVMALVGCVLTGRIRLNIGVLLPGMLAALTLALVAGGIVWRMWGKSGTE